MIDSFYKQGRFLSLVLYFIQGLLAVIMSIFDKETRVEITITLFILWIFSMAVLMLIRSIEQYESLIGCMVSSLCSVILAVGVMYMLRSATYLFVFFMIEWACIIPFFSRQAAVFLGLLQALTLFLQSIFQSFGVRGYISHGEMLFGVLGIALMTWLTDMLIRLVIKSFRRFTDQENSMEDLLHVVEVMCDEARHATKSKSDFLSNMSHEIRTPINAVLGMNEMILRESKEEATLKYASDIEEAGNILLSLINDILDFSKIESGKMELVQVEYEMSSTLNGLVSLAMPRIEAKQLDFEVKVEGEVPEYLYGDEVRIRQIVTNFLTNAAKYTDAGKVTLTVKAKKRGDNQVNLFFEVTDTGRGIKKEDQKKLFQAFQRLDSKNNRNIEGTGLGLAIASSFVQMMNGKMEVESEYGKGSTFRVIIPQRVVKNIPMGDFKGRLGKKIEINAYEALLQAPQARVMVVDDTPMNLKVVTSLLKKTGVQITSLSSGQEALDLLHKEKFDLLFLDHMMPGMDGVETLKAIQEQKLAEGMPVIALTANAISGSKEMYLGYGFSDYLSKPVKGIELEEALQKWLPAELIVK